MSLDLVPLAVLMALVTYPSRALPLVLSRTDRLPPAVIGYLRLVAPAVLGALAAANAMVVVTTLPDGTRLPSFHVGVEWVAILACVAIVARLRNVLLGVVAAVAIVVAARAAGFG